MHLFIGKVKSHMTVIKCRRNVNSVRDLIQISDKENGDNNDNDFEDDSRLLIIGWITDTYQVRDDYSILTYQTWPQYSPSE